MPIEIALTNVDVEAGQIASGEDDAPWLLGFKDATSGLVVSVAFTAEKLRETVDALSRALDGEVVRPKPKIATATEIPRRIA